MQILVSRLFTGLIDEAVAWSVDGSHGLMLASSRNVQDNTFITRDLYELLKTYAEEVHGICADDFVAFVYKDKRHRIIDPPDDL